MQRDATKMAQSPSSRVIFYIFCAQATQYHYVHKSQFRKIKTEQNVRKLIYPNVRKHIYPLSLPLSSEI